VTPTELDDLVEYYLGVLITAGDFAHEIQSRVDVRAGKQGQNEWVEAVTDADIAVQTYVEVATLARDPELGFFGEEWAQSANHKYFNAEAETVVNLDPVNGTFLYKSGRDSWDIILSVAHDGDLLAAVSYMPVRGVFYLALRDRGALTGTRDEPRLDAMHALHTQSGSGVCLTYQAPTERSALSKRFDTFDIVEDYNPERAFDNLNDLFTGRLDAFACRRGEMLDWGAIAFIVDQAGGTATTLDGAGPLFARNAYRADEHADMLVAANPAVHSEILGLLTES
jgi:myo-inositol-1(or 4)-monophosphatase